MSNTPAIVSFASMIVTSIQRDVEYPTQRHLNPLVSSRVNITMKTAMEHLNPDDHATMELLQAELRKSDVYITSLHELTQIGAMSTEAYKWIPHAQHMDPHKMVVVSTAPNFPFFSLIPHYVFTLYIDGARKPMLPGAPDIERTLKETFFKNSIIQPQDDPMNNHPNQPHPFGFPSGEYHNPGQLPAFGTPKFDPNNPLLGRPIQPFTPEGVNTEDLIETILTYSNTEQQFGLSVDDQNHPVLRPMLEYLAKNPAYESVALSKGILISRVGDIPEQYQNLTTDADILQAHLPQRTTPLIFTTPKKTLFVDIVSGFNGI